jgi:DhnA family fructose-bisphosphate aldolase class Ia
LIPYAGCLMKLVNNCPVPVVVAGGKKLPEPEVLELA